MQLTDHFNSHSKIWRESKSESESKTKTLNATNRPLNSNYNSKKIRECMTYILHYSPAFSGESSRLLKKDI